MSAVLFLPAAAVVVAVVLLAAVSGRMRAELAGLRRSLRRLDAAAVAGSELSRTLGRVSRRAAALHSSAGPRLSRNRARANGRRS